MDVNHLPAEAGTATLEDLVTALAAVQWDFAETEDADAIESYNCLLYTSPSPRDRTRSRMPSSA